MKRRRDIFDRLVDLKMEWPKQACDQGERLRSYDEMDLIIDYWEDDESPLGVLFYRLTTNHGPKVEDVSNSCRETTSSPLDPNFSGKRFVNMAPEERDARRAEFHEHLKKLGEFGRRVLEKIGDA